MPRHPQAAEIPEADQAEDHVPRQARDDLAVLPSASVDGGGLGKAAAFRVLRMVQDELAGLPDLPVLAARAKLGQDDELPDRPPAFWLYIIFSRLT